MGNCFHPRKKIELNEIVSSINSSGLSSVSLPFSIPIYLQDFTKTLMGIGRSIKKFSFGVEINPFTFGKPFFYNLQSNINNLGIVGRK